MKKVHSAKKEMNYDTGIDKAFYSSESEMSMYFNSWPVYAPYRIEKKAGELVITGDWKKYWQAWKGSGGPEELRDLEGITYIRPQEEAALLKDILALDPGDDEQVIYFVNRYGLLGLSFWESPLWITAQVPAASFSVWEEDLFEFKGAVTGLQECYKLWKKGDMEGLLPVLQKRLAGIREYPQLNYFNEIIPGRIGTTLLDCAWLHFYLRVIGEWKICCKCGSSYEEVHGNQQMCPECQRNRNTLKSRERREKIKIILAWIDSLLFDNKADNNHDNPA